MILFVRDSQQRIFVNFHINRDIILTFRRYFFSVDYVLTYSDGDCPCFVNKHIRCMLVVDLAQKMHCIHND